MVLQQETPIRVWGWADPGEKVIVSLGDSSEQVTADEDGKWSLELPGQKASHQPHVLQVAGKNEIKLADVLIGEVWLCSGQSNMEWTVARSTNAKAEIAAANFPLIRHVKVNRVSSTTPRDDIKAPWQVCSPETAGNFTAAGYFMARYLHQELGVPIGLINSSWGGTRVEPWTPPVGFQSVKALQDIYQSVIGRTPGTPAYEAALGKHIDRTEAWVEKAKEFLQSDSPASTKMPPSPAYPSQLAPFKSHQDPTMLYNAMIHALVGYPMRGAIWYQGESNHGEGMLYTEKKRALINGWRSLWGIGDFPFYYVQIAPFQYGNEDPLVLAKFWEAQAKVQEMPNTGMVVINDIATLNDIHPPNKQDVGHRLALLALKNDYGQSDLVANSPEMESMEALGDRLKITFKNSGGSLKTRDGQAPSHFELIGPGSRGFQPADAQIEGNAIVLTSAAVPTPTGFRFAWHKLAEPNLVGATGLPVGAFRGGEEPDFQSLLSIDNEYQLVYELDLNKLQSTIVYDVDRSDEVKPFDRVGYLLELRSDRAGDQQVFVAMDAFTDDAKQIGVPTTTSKARFQQNVKNMDVFSNVDGVKTATSIETGNIEFWPNNYGPGNGHSVAGASISLFDFGDEPGPPTDGYGSMQVHNFGAKQTIFAINHWSAGAAADIGIGNSASSQSRDWTFSQNAKSYAQKRLKIFVRQK